MKIQYTDTDGIKGSLPEGYLGYDKATADRGRVAVGTNTGDVLLAKKSEVDSHTNSTNNPHSVTKAQVGLSNVDNTSDANKPVSTATQNALNLKANDSAVVNLNGNQTIAGIKTFSSTISGSITGNSGTATKLATARTIGGVSFDGTANINLPGVNAGGNQDTTGNSGTATKLQTARTINGVAFDGTSNITVSDDTKLTKINPVITGSITEQVYNLTGTAINPANGTIQYKTVSANTTFTETLTAGQSVILRLIDASNYTITFPTITWVGAVAPTLTANCAIVLWKEQATLYGAFVGTLV